MAQRNNEKPSELLAHWRAAFYIRLSREDGNDESYSVKNQRQRLKEYLESLASNERIKLEDCYIDDGYTGTDSDRDGFQRMLADIDKGKINCVIVKDLSRLSRNDWECKKYLQHFFVVKDVRFISLELPKLDSYKNPDEIYEMGVSIQSMYNENHCRETSVKVRGTFNMKRKKGEFIGAFAPYGYQKSPDNKHKLIIDEETVAVVKDIFNWYVYGGLSKNAIVRKLISLGVSSPAAYKKEKGMKYQNPSSDKYNPVWSARSITSILTNKMYLGHMVQGKQKVKSYKVHTRINIPQEEWCVVENTHEKIIDEQTFNAAQSLMCRNTRTAPDKGSPYVFSGFLRCADCKKAMGRRTAKGNVYYACRTNTVQGTCTRHSIRHDKLEKAVLKAIQKQVEFIRKSAEIIKEIEKTEQASGREKMLDDAIKNKNLELKKASRIKAELYMDWKNGDITRDEYHEMKSEFEKKIKLIDQDLKEIEKEKSNIINNIDENSEIKNFIKYKNITFLSRGIVAALIKTIYIHEGGKITIEFNVNDVFSRNVASFFEI